MSVGFTTPMLSMNIRIIVLVVMAFLLAGCGEFHPIWHDQKLPSGKTVKVTSFNLTWGAEHNERDQGKDSLDLEYVSTNPDAPAEAREREAREVFELIRPTAELWSFTNAAVAGFRAVERKGHYDLYIFSRAPDGKWSSQYYARKVFVND